MPGEEDSGKTQNNVNIETYDMGPDESRELLIRHSNEAPEIRQPVKIRISGNIFAPQEWYKLRKKQELVDPEKAHVEVDRWNHTIKFYQNQSDIEAAIITGKLEKNPDLAALGINGSKVYDKEKFVRMLKLNRHLFQDQSVNMGLVKQLKDLDFKVSKKIEDKDDHRGNKDKVLRQTVESDLPKKFNLSMPIYKGKPPYTFEVELNYDVSQNSVGFWFTSPELAEHVGTFRDKLFEEALEEMVEDLVIIEK